MNQALLVANLRSVVLAMWAIMYPGLERCGDAGEIASAIAQTVVEDGSNAPVLGSHAEDAAAMAYWAVRESWLRKWVVGDGGRSYGVWQQRRAAGKADVLTQARSWLRLLHEGQAICPDSPAAPLSGGCDVARTLADRRARAARGWLYRALQAVDLD